MVGRRGEAGLWVSPDAHIGGVLGVTDFHESEEIELMDREPMEELKEKLQLLARQRLVVSLVAHTTTMSRARRR